MNELQQFYVKTWQAMIHQDEAKLREYHDESFVLVHMTGKKSPLNKFISEIKNKELEYQSVKHDSIVTEIKNEEAKIVGQSYVLASVYGMKARYWRLQLTFYLRYINNQWKYTYCKATMY